MLNYTTTVQYIGYATIADQILCGFVQICGFAVGITLLLISK